MSRAFVKENDLEHAGIDIPERPLSVAPNYVTPNGLMLLKEKFNMLVMERERLKQKNDDSIIKQKIALLDRDMRYYASRIESAILAPKNEDNAIVLFGAKVTVEDEEGKTSTFEIVGEDESDAHLNKVSYSSPLAEALIGSKEGDEVTWEKPIGDTYLTIQKIEY